jgi:hypothetical protein
LLDAIREAMEHEGLDRSIQKSRVGLRLIGEPDKQNLLAFMPLLRLPQFP